MTLVLELPVEVEIQLQDEAAARDVAVEAVEAMCRGTHKIRVSN